MPSIANAWCLPRGNWFSSADLLASDPPDASFHLWLCIALSAPNSQILPSLSKTPVYWLKCVGKPRGVYIGLFFSSRRFHYGILNTAVFKKNQGTHLPFGKHLWDTVRFRFPADKNHKVVVASCERMIFCFLMIFRH